MANIAIFGLGYVGLAMAALLSQNNKVVGVDVCSMTVDKVNSNISPINDKELESHFSHNPGAITASLVPSDALTDVEYIIIATPTDYNESTNYFDTASVENVLESVINSVDMATIVIKSTVPVGFVDQMRLRYGTDRVIFSPEFLREGHALYDNLYPSRIIIGDKGEKGAEFAELLLEGAHKKNVPVLLTGTNEAEAIKLFSNTYLAVSK